MKDIYIRTLTLADYVIKNKAAIRQTAKYFDMAKSTVHYDLAYRLPYIAPTSFEKVKKILKLNFSEKHIRGGEATKRKYLAQKN